MWISPNTDYYAAEMDEVFWFIKCRKDNDMGINTYIMTIISRCPRQIIAFAVDNSVKAAIIQQIVDSTKPFQKYFVDGCTVYRDVDYLGLLRQNCENKNDTYLVEGTNADLRHYIAGLRRKSRCFFRKFSTLRAVLYVFINAYNKFGEWKRNYFNKHPLADRDLGFNHTRFI